MKQVNGSGSKEQEVAISITFSPSAINQAAQSLKEPGQSVNLV
jgi:hypothetical protein